MKYSGKAVEKNYKVDADNDGSIGKTAFVADGFFTESQLGQTGM